MIMHRKMAGGKVSGGSMPLLQAPFALSVRHSLLEDDIHERMLRSIGRPPQLRRACATPPNPPL